MKKGTKKNKLAARVKALRAKKVRVTEKAAGPVKAPDKAFPLAVPPSKGIVGVGAGREVTPVAPADPVVPATVPAAKVEVPKPERKLSLIKAAAEILSDGIPRNCGEIVRVAGERGLWSSPKGKTPAATLHTALITEIRVKGEASRFAKVDRGLFARKA